MVGWWLCGILPENHEQIIIRLTSQTQFHCKLSKKKKLSVVQDPDQSDIGSQCVHRELMFQRFVSKSVRHRSR